MLPFQRFLFMKLEEKRYNNEKKRNYGQFFANKYIRCSGLVKNPKTKNIIFQRFFSMKMKQKETKKLLIKIYDQLFSNEYIRHSSVATDPKTNISTLRAERVKRVIVYFYKYLS